MIRSLLIAPANRHDLLAKFVRADADCSVIDLEDGTPAPEKLSARAGLAQAVAGVRQAGYAKLLAVRVNEPMSPLFMDDLRAALACGADAVVIPKVEHAAQLEAPGSLDAPGGGGPRPFIIAGIESALGVLNVHAICKGPGDIRAVYFGAEDYAASVGGRRTREGLEVLMARSTVVMAARASGISALDQVVIDIRDDALFNADAGQGRSLGYDGKTCLTPGQVKLAHAAFSPTAEEYAYAARLVKAYEAATSDRRGVIEFEGKMVDIPILKQAQATLARGPAPGKALE